MFRAGYQILTGFGIVPVESQMESGERPMSTTKSQAGPRVWVVLKMLQFEV
jgi:hypothetical protein